jgi:GTP-binding protein
MPVPEKLPIVAIVGRPNVGKSTLFNRYAGVRRALVEDEPGVTRDTIAQEVAVAGRRVLLVDTAGLDLDPADGLPAAVQAQARAALEQADAILFVVDGKAGLAHVEEEIARALHRTAKPVALVVNKIDHASHAPRIADFARLGFAASHAVSAEHGSGAWDALEELVARLPPGAAPAEAAEPEVEADDETAEAEPAAAAGGVRIAIVGRPNVGKSSLVNRLLGAPRLVVSEVPGTTRDSIDTRVEIRGRAYTLIDTAGMRRAGRRTGVAERGSALMAVRSLERADAAVLVLDAGEGPTEQDARVLALVQERGCPVVIAANKWDLVAGRGDGRAREVDAAIADALRFVPHAPVLHVSARTGAGVARLLPEAERVAGAGRRRIATAELNRWLRESVGRHEPAMAQRGARRRPIKFFYATQASVRPPTFVLFCTEPAAVAPSYRRFLENRLRESFDFRGTPVRLRLRARTAE